MYIGKELHFNNSLAFTFAGVASTTVDVERKMLGLKAANF